MSATTAPGHPRRPAPLVSPFRHPLIASLVPVVVFAGLGFYVLAFIAARG